MEMQPIERQGNLDHAEPSADVRLNVGSTPPPSESGGSPAESNPPEKPPIQRQGNSDHAEPPAGIPEDVLDGHRYRPLLQAAFDGDWKSATKFFQYDPDSKTAIITSRYETVLHIAALNAQDQFVEKLVKLLSREELEKVDCSGRTALHNAVLCGRIRMVKALVKSNPSLTQIPDKEGRVPFHISTREASMHKEIAWFLAKKTTDGEPFNSSHAIESIVGLTYAGHHDIVLYLVGRYPRFLLMKGPNETDNTILGVLARMESHFLSGTRLSVWEALIYKCITVNVTCNPTLTDPALEYLATLLWNAAKIFVPTIKRIHEVKLRHVAAVKLAEQICIAISSKNTGEITQFFQDRNLLGQAAIKGISELVKLCIQYFPHLIWVSPFNTSLTTLAVGNRRERILRLFLRVTSTNRLSFVPAPTPEESFDIMLAAATYNPDSSTVTNVSGAAFQMQRELQWFKAVESWVKPDLRTIKCVIHDPKTTECVTSSPRPIKHDHKTFWQIFVKEHEKLLETGEKWVKDTANSCMLVSTLITTVLFAAAFTVPGSNHGSTGRPLLLGENSLLVFAISDALGLLSSVAAILLFLAILTSRYEPEDFLDSLPEKIILGLLFLFLSLAFMLVAFAATLTIMLEKRLEWVIIPVTLLTSLPMGLFIKLQLLLLFQMVRSTYGPSIFHSGGTWK